MWYDLFRFHRLLAESTVASLPYVRADQVVRYRSERCLPIDGWADGWLMVVCGDKPEFILAIILSTWLHQLRLLSVNNCKKCVSPIFSSFSVSILMFISTNSLGVGTVFYLFLGLLSMTVEPHWNCLKRTSETDNIDKIMDCSSASSASHSGIYSWNLLLLHFSTTFSKCINN